MNEIIFALEKSYINIRHKTDKYYRGGVDLLNILPYVALFCTTNQLDPDIYVKALDKYKTTPKLYPNQLKNKNAISIYNKYLAEFNSSDYSTSLEVQKKYLLEAIKNGRSVESVLLDDNIDFEPWFRILVTKKNIPSVIEKYRDAASEALNDSLLKMVTEQGFDIKRVTTEFTDQ